GRPSLSMLVRQSGNLALAELRDVSQLNELALVVLFARRCLVSFSTVGSASDFAFHRAFEKMLIRREAPPFFLSHPSSACPSCRVRGAPNASRPRNWSMCSWRSSLPIQTAHARSWSVLIGYWISWTRSERRT